MIEHVALKNYTLTINTVIRGYTRCSGFQFDMMTVPKVGVSCNLYHATFFRQKQIKVHQFLVASCSLLRSMKLIASLPGRNALYS